MARADVRYVDANSPPGGDGTNWAAAFDYLQDALALATAGDLIRVADGTYKPDQGQNQTPGDRAATFQLASNIALYGGYAGYGAPNPDDRDFVVYETILSGDLAGDDGPNFANNDENSYSILDGSGTDATAILDGFTVTAANGFDSGGLYNAAGHPSVRNCTFRENYARRGGGIFNDASNPTIADCTFVGNFALRGGGIHNDQSSPTLLRCTFVDNEGWHVGGAVNNQTNSHPTVTNSVFFNNTSEYAGALSNRDGCNSVVRDCLFSGNTATYGGALRSNGSQPTFLNCTFVYNVGGDANALSCDSTQQQDPSTVVLRNCVLWDGGTEIVINDGSTVALYYCDITGGWSGPGSDNLDADPLFVDPDGPDDDPLTWQDNDYHLGAASPCIDAGDPAFVPQLAETDFDRQMRVWDGDDDDVATVDVGADEFGSYIYGDLNCDGLFNAGDIPAFVLALTDAAAYAATYPDCDRQLADINGDGLVNGADIPALVALFTGD